MSRLLQRIHERIEAGGPVERARLCGAIGRSERTLLRWLKDGIPTTHDAVTLAKAVGVESDEEALALAREDSQAKRAG